MYCIDFSEPHAELIGVHPVFAGENLTLTCNVTECNPTPTSRYQFYVGQTSFLTMVRTSIFLNIE